MNQETKRFKMRERIRANIDRNGFHITLVAQGVVPRFAYTIGLKEKIGAELVFAGASTYNAEQVHQLMSLTAAGYSQGDTSLRQVDSTWARLLLLGAFDFYDEETIPALQLLPDRDHWTIEVPDLSKPFSHDREPVWQWLVAPWTLPIPKHSTAVTDLAALRGGRITEAARWEHDAWELFAGSETPEAEMLVIPFSTLYAVDSTLEAVAALPVGSALWREREETDWHAWSRKS